MRNIKLAGIVLGLFAWLTMPAHAETVASPDGAITLTLDVDGEGKPYYTIARGDEAVISQSGLGFNFIDTDPIRRNFEIVSAVQTSGDSTWEQPWGERRYVRDHHNEITVTFREKVENDPRTFIIRARAFDGGVGFRYEFPEQAGFDTANIAEELTEFNLASNGTAWWVPAGDWNRYEYIYSETPVDAVPMVHTPFTAKLDSGTHVAIHEASLVDYAGMWLRRIDGTRFRAMLAPSSRGAKVVRDLPFHTPWRTIRISGDAAGLYDNDIDLNLNEPNKLGDVSWFTPHKYIGIWWEMHLNKSSWASGENHGATTENAKKHIDFAAEHGFRGILIEGWNIGWDGNWFGNGRDYSFTKAYPDFDYTAVTDYARAKGVHLIGHHETGGNIQVYEAQLEDAMRLYGATGTDSVKTGYVADAGGIIAPGPDGGEVFEWHDGQRMAQHHLKVIEAAARHGVAVNPHEPIKATGLRRTYPNWVSREGARGMEYQAWGVPKNPPEHVPTLVFTRMLSGPMDYTPGVLSLIGRDNTRIPSTLARPLALYIVIYSPIQMAADLPENLAKYPEELAFISRVPADWAESKTLQAEVGDYAVIARKDRNSEKWYMGGVTDSEGRSVSFALDFLEEGRSYSAKVYRDGPDADGLGEERHDIRIETTQVKAGDLFEIHMARSGGFAVEFVPE